MLLCELCGTENPAVAFYCFHCGRRFSEKKPQSSDQDLRILTILFADLQGFSGVSTQFSPDVLKELLDDCFERLNAEILRESGKVIKYDGDGLMAVFGLDAGTENAPVLAAYAAIRMQKVMREFARERHSQTGVELSLRIGLNTGQVAVGYVGSGLDVIGSAVNVAKRMEQNASAGGSMMPWNMALQLKDRFRLSQPQEISIKGFEAPIQVCELLGKNTQSRRVILGRVSQTQLRQQEFSRITLRFESQRIRRIPHLFLIESDAGLGKSRILQDFVQYLGLLQPKALHSYCQFSSTLNEDYRVLRILLYQYNLMQFCSLAACMARDLPTVREGQINEMALSIARLLNLPHPPVSQFLSQEEMALEAYQSTLIWLQAVSRRVPLVLIIDDMHLADEGSLKLLDYLLSSLKGQFFVLCAGRRNRRNPDFIFRSRNCSRLDLEPVDYSGLLDYAKDLLEPVSGIPAELVESLVRRSNGNPLFLEELILHLHHQGTIRAREGVFQYDPMACGSELPTTIELVVQEKVDSLSREQKECLQSAALIGISVSIKILRALHEIVLDSCIAAAEKLGLLQSDTVDKVPIHKIRFSSESIRSAIMRGMTKRRMQEVHLQIGMWMQANPEAIETTDQRACDHFRQSSKPQLALPFSLRVAKRCVQSFQWHRAAREYKEILKSADRGLFHLSQDELWECVEEFHKVLQLLGRTQEASKLVQSMLTKLQPQGPGYVRVMLKEIQSQANKMTAAQVRETFASIQAACPPQLSQEVALGQVQVCLTRGEHSKAAQILDELFANESKYDPLFLARLYCEAGKLLYYQDNFADARARFRRGRDLALQARDERQVAILLHNEAETLRRLGGYPEAASMFEQAVAAKESVGDLVGSTVTLLLAAKTYRQLGRVTLAETTLDRCLKQARLIGNFHHASMALLERARISLLNNAPEQSLKLYWYALQELLRIPAKTRQNSKDLEEFEEEFKGIFPHHTHTLHKFRESLAATES